MNEFLAVIPEAFYLPVALIVVFSWFLWVHDQLREPRPFLQSLLGGEDDGE